MQIIERALSANPTDVVLHSLRNSRAKALSNIGVIHHTRGVIPQALEFYHKSLKIREEISDKQGMSYSYNNIGLIHSNQGAISLALEYYHKSLKIQEEISDKRGIATSYNNIGFIHSNQGDIHLALEYYHKSLKIEEEISDSPNEVIAKLGKHGMANSYNNIGGVHKDQGSLPLALKYLLKSLKIQEEISDKQGMANSYNNVGFIHNNQGDLPLALVYYYKSLKIQEEISDKKGIANTLANIGTLHLKQAAEASDNKSGARAAARKAGERGLKIALELGFPDQMRRNAALLSKVAKQEGNFQQALEMYELQVQYRDSLNNEETQKASIRQQTKYEFEKAQLVKEQEKKELARVLAEETSRRDNLQYSIVLICLLAIGGLVAMLGRLSLPERVAEGLIFFAFLIFFEFVLVLADPYVENWTGGAPGLKLLINAGVAAFIFPLHAFFEGRLKSRLVKTSG
ncbi:MAG: tetratricopeptide repeat protein, partial [Flavobacteriales bacterium]|nr:tetratricopeptide repeat protein [Flavobacteriales bacterium]